MTFSNKYTLTQYPLSVNANFYFSALFLFKSSTDCLHAAVCTVSLDCDLLSLASVICIVDTFYRLTVDTVCRAWMLNRADKRGTISFMKAFATGILAAFGMLAAYHNITFTTAIILIIGTGLCSTSKLCHITTSFSYRVSMWHISRFIPV